MNTSTHTDSVLVVEDDQLLADLLARKLNSEGIEVIPALTGEDALERMNEKGEPPSLVLLDIRLPGIDGFEVLKQIKENPDTKDIPVIILSNFGEPDDISRGKELGAEQYIVKVTLTLDQIVDMVRASFKNPKS